VLSGKAMTQHALLAPLAPLRAHAGKRRTVGLEDDVLARFADDIDLAGAIDAAAAEYARLKDEFADMLDLDEDAQAGAVQAAYVNFYPDDAVNPYVALAARGPWIVTLKSAVLHDSGGDGRHGLGHAPADAIEAMARPQAMADIMTPSLSQLRFSRMLRGAIGLGRECPFERFFRLNSGSESVTLAARIADANAKALTDP